MGKPCGISKVIIEDTTPFNYPRCIGEGHTCEGKPTIRLSIEMINRLGGKEIRRVPICERGPCIETAVKQFGAEIKTRAI